MAGGRPTSYKPEYTKQAYHLALLGATDVQMAAAFDITEKTLHNWRNTIPEFLQSTKKGKEIADANVARALYRRATGYKWKEQRLVKQGGEEVLVDVVRKVPPDTAAICYWMNNRQKGLWSNVQKIEVTDGNSKPRELSRAEIEKELAAELKGKKAANG